MGLRTIQVLGQAYSESGSVSINATIDGNIVWNAVVPTTAAAAPEQNLLQEVLFQFDVPDTMYNITVASSFTVTGGTAFIAGLAGNNLIAADLTAFKPLWRSPASMKTNIVLDGTLIDAIDVNV